MLNASGLWISVRQEIGSSVWIVSVLNFATWRHKYLRYPDEASARAAYALWTL